MRFNIRTFNASGGAVRPGTAAFHPQIETLRFQLGIVRFQTGIIHLQTGISQRKTGTVRRKKAIDLCETRKTYTKEAIPVSGGVANGRVVEIAGECHSSLHGWVGDRVCGMSNRMDGVGAIVVDDVGDRINVGANGIRPPENSPNRLIRDDRAIPVPEGIANGVVDEGDQCG